MTREVGWVEQSETAYGSRGVRDGFLYGGRSFGLLLLGRVYVGDVFKESVFAFRYISIINKMAIHSSN
jgi:hypothetical protein